MEPNLDHKSAFEDFRSYHFDQIRTLANIMTTLDEATVEDMGNLYTLSCLLRDKVNEASEHLDQIVWKE